MRCSVLQCVAVCAIHTCACFQISPMPPGGVLLQGRLNGLFALCVCVCVYVCICACVCVCVCVCVADSTDYLFVCVLKNQQIIYMYDLQMTNAYVCIYIHAYVHEYRYMEMNIYIHM